MARMKDLRDYIAEEIVKQSPLTDIDMAYVMVDELWDRAARQKDKKAITKLGKYVKAWKGEKELV